MAMIFFTRHAEKDLKNLPVQAIQELRTEHIPLLEENPRLGKPLHGPLRGYFSYEFHCDGVAYRIAYEIIAQDVAILMIDARDNFYKKFSRRAK